MKASNGGEMHAPCRLVPGSGHTCVHLLLMLALLLLPVSTMGMKEDSLRLDLQSRCLKKPFLPECRGSVLKRAVQNSLSLDKLLGGYYWATDTISRAPTLEPRTWNTQMNEALNPDDNNFMGTYSQKGRVKSNQGDMLDGWFRLHRTENMIPTQFERHVPVLRRWVNYNNDKY